MISDIKNAKGSGTTSENAEFEEVPSIFEQTYKNGRRGNRSANWPYLLFYSRPLICDKFPNFTFMLNFRTEPEGFRLC